MNKSDTIGKIAAALVAAQSEIKAAQKSGDNKFDKYRYSKLEDFFDAAKAVLTKYKLAVVMSNNGVSVLPDRVTKNGGSEHACQVTVTATLVHESGEFISIEGHGEGQDRADKSIYKAITGAKKYILAGLLAIPTTDDPEADETVGQSSMAKKTDSKGNPAQKLPSWTNDQSTEAGKIRADIIDEFGDKGDALVKELKHKYKYDPPHEVIDQMATLLNELREGVHNV